MTVFLFQYVWRVKNLSIFAIVAGSTLAEISCDLSLFIALMDCDTLRTGVQLTWLAANMICDTCSSTLGIFFYKSEHSSEQLPKGMTACRF